MTSSIINIINSNIIILTQCFFILKTEEALWSESADL